MHPYTYPKEGPIGFQLLYQNNLTYLTWPFIRNKWQTWSDLSDVPWSDLYNRDKLEEPWQSRVPDSATCCSYVKWVHSNSQQSSKSAIYLQMMIYIIYIYTVYNNTKNNNNDKKYISLNSFIMLYIWMYIYIYMYDYIYMCALICFILYITFHM